MNNEQEIEKIAYAVRMSELSYENRNYADWNKDEWLAHSLYSAGIGDKKQAVKEFMEKLKETSHLSGIYKDNVVFCSAMDELFTELYGAE